MISYLIGALVISSILLAWFLLRREQQQYEKQENNNFRRMVNSEYRADHERGLHLAEKVDGCPMCQERE